MSGILLKVHDLKAYYDAFEGTIRAVDGITFDIRQSEIFGLLGESGCGKSTVALSILRLLPPPGRIAGGEILFEGESLLSMTENEIRKMRGEKISLISQDPTASLNPVFKIGEQIIDALMAHRNLTREHAYELALKKLELVQLPNPHEIYEKYPHELSGGMRQRVMIAAALACEPSLLIADEPTTALDVTIQAQILDLMKSLCEKLSMSVLLITHNLGIAAEICDRLGIMYAGQLVEVGPVASIFEKAVHPYTCGLLRAVPTATEEMKQLYAIQGDVPDLINPPNGCRFHPRCPYVEDTCRKIPPLLFAVEQGHHVRCCRGR